MVAVDQAHQAPAPRLTRDTFFPSPIADVVATRLALAASMGFQQRLAGMVRDQLG